MWCHGFVRTGKFVINIACCFAYKTIAHTSTAPITVQQIALPRSPASQKPLAALKQRIALVHPLTNAPGLLNILRRFIKSVYD